MNVKRFDIKGYNYEVFEDCDGCFVEYSDYEILKEELEVANKIIASLTKEKGL